jgi:cytidylate kinase
MQEFGYDPHEAQKAMEHRDRERMNYCRHYTHKIWGRPSNYDLIIDSSRFGIDCSVALICDAVEQRWNHSMASVA